MPVVPTYLGLDRMPRTDLQYATVSQDRCARGVRAVINLRLHGYRGTHPLWHERQLQDRRHVTGQGDRCRFVEYLENHGIYLRPKRLPGFSQSLYTTTALSEQVEEVVWHIHRPLGLKPAGEQIVEQRRYAQHAILHLVDEV